MNAVTYCGITWSRDYYYFDEQNQLQTKTLNLFERILRACGWYQETHLKPLVEKAHTLAFHNTLADEAVQTLLRLVIKVDKASAQKISSKMPSDFLFKDVCRDFIRNDAVPFYFIRFQLPYHALAISKAENGQLIIDGIESPMHPCDGRMKEESLKKTLVLAAKILCDSNLPSLDCIVEREHGRLHPNEDRSISCKDICKRFEEQIAPFGWVEKEDFGLRERINPLMRQEELALQGRNHNPERLREAGKVEVHKKCYQLRREAAQQVLEKHADEFFNRDDSVSIKAFIPFLEVRGA